MLFFVNVMSVLSWPIWTGSSVRSIRARIAQSVEHQTFKELAVTRHLRVWGSSPHAGYNNFFLSKAIMLFCVNVMSAVSWPVWARSSVTTLTARIAQSVEHQTFKELAVTRHLRVWGSSPHAGYNYFFLVFVYHTTC